MKTLKTQFRKFHGLRDSPANNTTSTSEGKRVGIDLCNDLVLMARRGLERPPVKFKVVHMIKTLFQLAKA